MINKKAFTLIEMLFVFILVGMIASILIGASNRIVTNKIDYEMTNSIFTILRKGVGEYIANEGEIESSSKLCKFLAENYNIIGSSNCPNSDGTVSMSNPNFMLKNGAVFYNFGSNLIVNGKSSYYTIYVDIDGNNYRKKELNKDLIPFTINKYGEVLPSGIAAESTNYIMAGYKYLNTVDDKSSWEWVATNLTYKDAICASGIKLQTKNYCSGKTVDEIHCKNTACQIYIKNK